MPRDAKGSGHGGAACCNVAWKSGSMPMEWQTGVVVPIFKKGDRRVCYQTTKPPWESLLQGVGEEALTDCRTSVSGGAVWLAPRSWNSGPDLNPCRVTEGTMGV